MDVVGEHFYIDHNKVHGGLIIKTKEGEHLASIGDFVIKGVVGEFYPCKPDVFEMTYEKEETKYVKLQHDLLTSKYTEVYHEPGSEMQYGAPHRFTVIGNHDDYFGIPLAEIHFQEGPIKECGVNGVCNEDLIAMVICRLEHFQKGQFACRENALAITKLEEALLWLRKRTMGREQRGVEGTNQV
ncbi:hypothetical protein ALO_12376 [Acetonema longum DSM 6540]|uniref:Acb2/Tad1 hairpin domain-containing protein n=2 Tax=Acetonema TaxID=2373 RepID=F7NK62_9FIRM|nr:hypothetical protein ALO_12376 [Acetonema longum DSM 6540]